MKSGLHEEIAKLGTLASGGRPFHAKLGVSEKIFETLGKMYGYFVSDITENNEVADYLASSGSFYKNFADYGQIYISEVYSTLFNFDSSENEAHVSFERSIQESFSQHLESVASLRKSLENQVDVHTLERKVSCITSCIRAMVTLLPDEKTAESFLVGKLSDRLLTKESTSILVLMVPLFDRLLNSIVVICQRFPGLFQIGIDLVKKFLLTPAPALQKLAKSKEQKYQKVKGAAVDAFKSLLQEDSSQVEAQMANLTNRSVTLLNRNESLALSHLYEIMVDILRISTSDTLRTNVYTTLHQSYDQKSGTNLERLVTLGLRVAETEDSASFEPPNICAEIVELTCRAFIAQPGVKSLTHLCNEMPYAHCEWLLHRILRLFTETAVPKSKKNGEHKNISLVDLVATLLRRLHTGWSDFSLQASMKPLFRDFWFYCTIFGFNDATLGFGSKVNHSIGEVAKYSPVLTFDENEPMKQTLATSTPIKSHGQVASHELESIRQGLMLALGSRDEINRLLPAMDYSYLIYHLTVLRLERLRLTACCAGQGKYDYEQVFGYIENQMIQRDKTVGKNCTVLFEIVHTIHNDFLAKQKEKRQFGNVDEALFNDTQLMLVKFNSMQSSSRRLADWNLTATINLFPHMMWHPDVIHSELDLVNQLSQTLTVNDSFTDAPELSLGRFSLKVPDNLETRQKMTQDFIKRSAVFLKQALSISPVLTRSHLQEYLRLKEDQHSTLSSETKSVFDLVGLKAGDFAFSGTRNKYAGEVAYMVKLLKGKGVDTMVQQYHDVIKSENIDEINEQLYRLTALVIIHDISSNQKRLLLRLISRAIVRCFDVSVMETTIQCWQWISSAKSELNDLGKGHMLESE